MNNLIFTEIPTNANYHEDTTIRQREPTKTINEAVKIPVVGSQVQSPERTSMDQRTLDLNNSEGVSPGLTGRNELQNGGAHFKTVSRQSHRSPITSQRASNTSNHKRQRQTINLSEVARHYVAENVKGFEFGLDQKRALRKVVSPLRGARQPFNGALKIKETQI